MKSKIIYKFTDEIHVVRDDEKGCEQINTMVARNILYIFVLPCPFLDSNQYLYTAKPVT